MAVKKSPTSRKGSVDSFAGLTAGLAHLTPSQRSMLFVLSDLGEPATIQMLSDRTGLHANSVRETLSVLMEAGLVRRSQVPSASRGRPAWEYETSVPADISAVMKEFTGFAFGFGLERMCALMYSLDDIRLMFDNDVRFLEQFS